MARTLLEPILDGGISNPHYFEGRVLTASALREDQEAHRERSRRLGRALGAGVVEGLWTSVAAGAGGGPPVVQVTAGLAITPHGEALELPADELLALTRAVKETAPEAGLFKACRPPSVGVEATGEGFYLLVLSPASGYRGRAPMGSLGEPKAGAGCGSRWAVEGVQLRLEPLDPLALPGVSDGVRDQIEEDLAAVAAGGGTAPLARLRNGVAHLCLGTWELAGFAADPFAREALASGGSEPELARYGALDALRAAGRLTACDVPLALLYWRLDGLRFTDNWAARRRLTPPATDLDRPTLSSRRRRAEAEAARFQFQEQLAALLREAADPAAIAAREHFRRLPAAGLLPLAAPGARGVDAVAFFDGLTAREAVFLEGARLGALLADGLAYPPLDLAGGEMLWRYLLRENRQEPATPPFLVFAGGHLPYYGDPQYDLSRWSFSNYGPGVAG